MLKKILCALIVGLFLFNCAGCISTHKSVSQDTLSNEEQKEIYTAELIMYYPDGSTETYPFQYDAKLRRREYGSTHTLYYYNSECILYTEGNQVIFYDNNEITDSFSGTYAIKIVD